MPPELLQIVFDMAGKDGESWQHLQLCLISRALLPFGQAVLYRDCNLLAPTTSTRNKSAVSGCISAKRTVLFFECLLPNLDTSRAKLFSSLSLNLGSHGSPPSWASRQFEELLRIFSESRATLTVLVAPGVLASTLNTLLQSTQAFLQVNIEVPRSAIDDHSHSGHLYQLIGLQEGPRTNRPLMCTIATLDDPASAPSRAASSTRQLIRIKGPLGVRGWSLCQIVAAATSHRVIRLNLLTGTQDVNTFATIASFQQARSVTMASTCICHTSQHAALLWQLVRSADLPDSIVRLQLHFASTRGSSGDLLQLLQTSEWAPAVRRFQWVFCSEAGVRAATESELLLLEDGVSYRDAFAEALAKRDAELSIWDGQRIITVS
jgi:hypothetical protein